LESSASPISKPSGISEFGCHFTLKNCNLPRLLPVCQNRGREVIFLGVFDLLRTQNWPKLLVHAPVVVIFHGKSKNIKFLSFGAP